MAAFLKVKLNLPFCAITFFLKRLNWTRSQFSFNHTLLSSHTDVPFLFHFYRSSLVWLRAVSFSFHWNENTPYDDDDDVDNDDDDELIQNL